MIKLDAGNVLLKPSHRRQLMGWLKRALRLSQRLGNLAISITMHRVGRSVEMRADVVNRRATASFRTRQTDWHYAARDLIRMITLHLHDMMLRGLPA